MKKHLLTLIALTLSAPALFAAPPAPTPQPYNSVPPNTGQQTQENQRIVSQHTTTVPAPGPVANPPITSISDNKHGAAPAH